MWSSLAVALALVAVGGVSTRAQEAPVHSGLKAYDTFRGALLDPTRWMAQWQCGNTVLECVREVQAGKLHLRTNGYGDETVDGGSQFGTSEVYLKKPSVTSFGAWVTVRSASAVGCPTGAGGDSLAQAALWASFFNDGGGNDHYYDVTTFLQLDHASSDPPGVLRAGGFVGSRYQTWPGGAFLGQVNVGERVFLNLAWEQASHRFAMSLFRPESNTFVRQYLPYVGNDTIPAAWPMRSLSARVLPVNCLGQRTSADVDVTYDGVVTN